MPPCIRICNEAQPGVQSCVHPLAQHEVEHSLLAELALPTPAVDTVELEDARWFHLTWLERQLSNSGREGVPLAVCPLQPIDMRGWGDVVQNSSQRR